MSADARLPLGKILLGQYRIDAHLGASPLGERYRVWHLHRAIPLGLILLPTETNADPEALRRIEAASPALKTLTHPRLLPFYGLQTSADGAFLLEAWSDGPTLADILHERAGRPLPLKETLTWLKAVTAALAPLRPLTHPMLAAEFIHFDAAGEIRLSLAPCALSDPQSNEVSEVYALAALTYKALTGIWPPEKTPRELNPEIPDFASRILLKGVAARAAERIPTAREFTASLSMAARIETKTLPEKITPEQAPVIQAILSRWNYLSPPGVAKISETDASPVQTVAPIQKNKPKNLLGLFTAGLSLTLVAVLLFTLGKLQPIQTGILLPIAETRHPLAAQASPPSPMPIFTLPAKPTESHGGHIYFTCTRGDYNQLCVINADGSGYNQLTTGPAHNYYPVVAPQGGMIVYASNRSGTFDLYLLLFSTGQLLQLTDKIGNVVSPDFAPDGNTIVFANRAADGPTSIWMVGKGGLNPSLVYAGPNTIVATAWSPDGKTIAFAMSVDLPTEYQIFVMDTSGQNVRQVSHGLQGVGGSLDWSPDGKSLLVYAGPVGDKDIFRLEIATGLTTQLTDGGNNAASSYSPDGQYIVFNSLRNNDQADLFIMHADGTEVRQLTDNPEPDWQPRWEP